MFDKPCFITICSHILIIINKERNYTMANPNKFKSVSVPIQTYKKLTFLAKDKMADFSITISKTIDLIASKEAKKKGYKNGHTNGSSK